VQGGGENGRRGVAPDMALERRAVSLEVVGELILLALVAGFFAYIVVSAFEWKLAAIVTPAMAIAVGTPFLIWRAVHVIRMCLWVQRAEVTESQIMDVGFRIGHDRKAERQRFFRITLAIGLLYAGIWLFGFHVTLPLWVFGYLYWFGNVRFVWAGLMGTLFLAFIIGVYDEVLGVYWNKPLVMTLFE